MADTSHMPEDVRLTAYDQEDDDTPLSDTLDELPSYIARGLVYVVLLFLCMAFVWSFLSEIDIFIAVPAMIIPEGNTRFIQPPLAGIVQQIYVQEGEKVKKDQTLMVIDSENVGKMLSEVRAAESAFAIVKKTRFEVLPQQVTHLKRSMLDEQEKFILNQQIYNISLAKLQETIKRYKLERQNAISTLRLVEKEVEVNQRLRTLGLIAEIKLLEVQKSQEEAMLRIQNVQSLLRDAAQEQELMAKNFAVLQKQHEALLRDLQEQIERLQREAEEKYAVAKLRYEQASVLAQLNLHGVSSDILQQAARGEGHATNRTVIVAPEDGIIAQILVRNTGEAVDRGQTIMALIPQGAQLTAELKIPNKDIGTVRTGQIVKLKFDAFPYAEYGTIAGRIVRILPEAQRDGTGESYYRAFSSLQQSYVRVGPDPVPLRPGMTASAEVVTDQKTVLALLFKPLTEFTTDREARK